MHLIQLWDKIGTTSIDFIEVYPPTPRWMQGLPVQIPTAAENLLFTPHSQRELGFPKQPKTMIIMNKLQL